MILFYVWNFLNCSTISSRPIFLLFFCCFLKDKNFMISDRLNSKQIRDFSKEKEDFYLPANANQISGKTTKQGKHIYLPASMAHISWIWHSSTPGVLHAIVGTENDIFYYVYIRSLWCLCDTNFVTNFKRISIWDRD